MTFSEQDLGIIEPETAMAMAEDGEGTRAPYSAMASIAPSVSSRRLPSAAA